MGPKKKGKRQSQADRLTNLEEKFDMLLQKLDMSQKSIPPSNTQQSEENAASVSGAMAMPENVSQPLPREGRPRTRLSQGDHDDNSTTPRTQNRARTSTPRDPRHSPRRHRSYTPPRRQKVDFSILSTADALNSPAAKVKAQQIIELLDPKLPGKYYDPYVNRPARYPMPRLFINISAQKVVKSYKCHDDLTLPQFLEGYMRMYKSETDERVRNSMIGHMLDIAVLLQDFGWEITREWSNSILTSIGQGDFGWDDHLKIEKEKMIKIMGASGGGKSFIGHDRNACLQFNAQKCPESESHGHQALHVCNFCLAAFGAEHDHPVMLCQKRSTYKKKWERGDQSRGARYDRSDQTYTSRAYNDSQQGQAGRGKGYFHRDTYNRQSQPVQADHRQWPQPSNEPKN